MGVSERVSDESEREGSTDRYNNVEEDMYKGKVDILLHR
jgi:hypothetical protein